MHHVQVVFRCKAGVINVGFTEIEAPYRSDLADASELHAEVNGDGWRCGPTPGLHQELDRQGQGALG